MTGNAKRFHQACVMSAAVLSAAALLPPQSAAAGFLERPEVGAFVDEMTRKHGFERDRLEGLLAQAELKENILRAIASPAEAKPWYQYRAIFLTQQRIDGGVTFWNRHKKLLTEAEARYGVAPEIIVAIIGVETRYGGNTGSFRVLDALATLAFAYPKRSRFFRSELEQFLLLAREEQLDPLEPKGSYAGAMGQPQFISSSYRRYAVDFDDDGDRDLWDNAADVIGSVANYFARHGWKRGQPITARATVAGDRYRSLLSEELKPVQSLKTLKENGVSAVPEWAEDQLATLFELEGAKEPEFWLGLHNFYVITRYNHSQLYAMAVYQLSREILEQRNCTEFEDFARSDHE